MGSGGAHVRLCGGLTVEIGGEAREGMLHGRQGRLLLAFLTLNRQRPVSRDALVEAIWGHGGAPPSDGALAPVLSRLRRGVAPATIEGRESVVLRLPEPAWIDVEAARAALDRARAGGDPAASLAAAEEAAKLVEPGYPMTPTLRLEPCIAARP